MTASDTSTERRGTASSRARFGRRWAAIGVTALCVLGATEAAARAVEPHVPVPLEWASDEIAIKVDQMDRRRARGQVGGVVIAGSSQSWGLDPQVLIDAGVADVAYNSAIPSGTAPVQRRWLLEEVVPRLQPDVVVWGVSAPDLNERRSALGFSYAAARATQHGVVADVDRWLAERSALIRLRPVLGSAARIDHALRAPLVTSTNTLIGDLGQRAGSTEYAMAPDDPAPPNVGEWRVGTTIDDLPATVRALRAQGIEVLLVLLPLPQRTIEEFAGGGSDWDLTIEMIGAIAADLDVQLLDGLTGYSDDLSYRDTSHLDAEASRALSEDIARALGGSLPPDLEPAVVAAMGPDAPTHPVRRAWIPRPGWLRIETAAPLTELGGTLLTINTMGDEDRDRVLVELHPRRRASTAQHLVDDRWERTSLPRTLAIDARTLDVEIPTLADTSTTVFRIVVSAIPGGSAGALRLSPGFALDELRGSVANTGAPAWDLVSDEVTPTEHERASLRRDGDRLVWTVPADDWTDELLIADLDGATTTLTWDPAGRTLVVDGAGGSGRLAPGSVARTDTGWTITVDIRSLPTGELDDAASPLTIGPRRRLDAERPLLAEGLDLVLR